MRKPVETKPCPQCGCDGTIEGRANKTLLVAAEKALAANDCPNCPNVGYTVRQTNDYGGCEQEQCEWCECEPTSRFKANAELREAIAKQNHAGENHNGK